MLTVEDFQSYLNENMMTKKQVCEEFGVAPNVFQDRQYRHDFDIIVPVGKINLYHREEMKRLFGGAKDENNR